MRPGVRKKFRLSTLVFNGQPLRPFPVLLFKPCVHYTRIRHFGNIRKKFSSISVVRKKFTFAILVRIGYTLSIKSRKRANYDGI